MSHWLGIDVGGTKIALAVGDSEGQLRASFQRPMEPTGSPAEDLRRIQDDAGRLLAEAQLHAADLEGIGIAVPGPYDRKSGRVLAPPNLPGWDDVAVAEPFANAFGCPVRVENDANAGALAEWHFGAQRGADSLVYLTMSTGIGGGLILGGRLLRGVADGAGEVGHVPVVWNGAKCACGLRGCLEAYIGGRAWTERLQRETPASSAVAEFAGEPSAARPEHVVEAARRGDAFGRAEMARFNEFLTRGLVQLVFTLAPEVVVLGTIPTAAGEELCLEPVRRAVAERTWSGVTKELRILGSTLGERRPYLAGLAAALQRD